jgi:hypothetical protein
MAKKAKSTERPKQTEIPIEGPGVATVTDKKLIALGDAFIDLRDQKAALATELGDTEKNILARMDELGIKIFRFGDQEMKAKDGARHVKVKTINVEGEAPEDVTEG